MSERPPVLIVYDEPEQFQEALATRFPQTAFVYATALDDVVPYLERHNPEAVFSIKHPGFDGALQRPILTHPSVRWVQVGGSGYEHFKGWDPERLTLTNAAGVLTPYLAETVIGAMLALNGGFLPYLRQQRERLWQPRSFYPLSDQTLLVIGVGAIGAAVARNAKALGMQVLGVRRTPQPHPSVDEMHGMEALPALLPRADFISVHVRSEASTRHLVNAELLAQTRRGVRIINTARGAVLDEAALIDALRGGQAGGAYLDVFETEPLPPDSPLWTMDNVLLTPHAADAVPDWPARLAGFFADNLERWLAEQPLRNVVR